MSDMLQPQLAAAKKLGFCEECLGYDHAPWCSEYREPVVECQFCDFKGSFIDGTKHRRETQHLLRTVATGNLRRSEAVTTEHQPAARGGGDKWRKVYDGPSRPMIETSDGKLLSISQFDAGRWVSYEQEDSDIDTIVTEHNQHQSLVAEREQWERGRKFLGDRLEAQAETMAKIVKERNQLRLALEVIRDSFWSEGEPFEERVEYLQQTARDILETVRQRSTSE